MTPHPTSVQGDLHHLPGALAPLIALPHWVLWRWEKAKVKNGGEEKWTKVPYQPDGRKAKNNDPKTWSSYDMVMAAVAKFDGIGFCLLNGNFAAFDIDHCRDPDTGDIDPWAADLVQRTGSYSEITVSGTGLRIIGYGDGPKLHRKLPVHNGVSVEVYRDAERYIVITGNPLPEAKDIINIDACLDTTVAELDGKNGASSGPSPGPDAGKDAPQLDWDKVAEHADWLKSVDDLPSDFSKKGRMIIGHSGTIEDLNEDLKQAGHEPYKSKWSSVSFALAAIFKAYGRFPLEKIAEALMCDLPCNQYVTRQSDEAKRRRAVERLLARSHGPREGTREHQYFKRDGHLYWRQSDKDPLRLANFTAAIIKDMKVDDGSEQVKRQFTIGYTIAGGQGIARIPAEQFDALNWVTRELGSDACITPGQQVRSHLANAIKSMDHDSRIRGTVYAHLGWRQINGQWLYLHADGAIGASGPIDGFTVDPGGELSRFALPTVAVADPCGALVTSLRMLDMTGGRITWPLLAAIYLAPLGEFVAITVSLFFTGGTGVRKSALQSVAQGYWYWEQGGKKLPANWSSTANSLEALAFRAKDVLLVIDDFCPRGSIPEQQRQHHTAERLIRAQGNQVGRGRMNADGSLRTEMYPRGLLAASGEDTPSGHSLRARKIICEISPGDVDLDVLTEMQSAAGKGVLKAAMAGYVKFIAAQDKSSFKRRVTELRAEAVKRLSGGHTRTPENTALLMLGVENLLAYAASIGADVNIAKLRGEAWEALLVAGQEQDRHQREEHPAEKFMVLLQGLLSSGRAHIRNAKSDYPPNDARMLGWIEKEYNDKLLLQPGGHAIGWIDGDDLLLDPSSTYAELQQFAQRQGQSLALTQGVLWKRLHEAGLLEPGEDGRYTVKKRIGRQRPRVLHLKMSKVLEIDPAPPEAPPF